jgi:hypothetical protein
LGTTEEEERGEGVQLTVLISTLKVYRESEKDELVCRCELVRWIYKPEINI